MEDILSAIDSLTGKILTEDIGKADYPPHFIAQVCDTLHEGTPWETRRRLAEALPGLCTLDVMGTKRLMELLRLDDDPVFGVDIRRRVIEGLPALFEASPASLSTIVRLLQPISDDDIYVSLVTIEACGDIQTSIKPLLENQRNGLARSNVVEEENAIRLLQQSQIEISKIQRQLLLSREGVERECIQFSLALHNLLCAPDTLLLSLKDGLESPEKLTQIVAMRYLERLLPVRTLEVLELYKMRLHRTTRRNVRRPIAKALPALLRALGETSLPTRTLARDVISTLATDTDVYIRRAVAEYSSCIFSLDREFLLILLRSMHKDDDHIIRHSLQPVALRLAEVWLTRYAETAALIDTTSLRRMHRSTKETGSKLHETIRSSSRRNRETF